MTPKLLDKRHAQKTKPMEIALAEENLKAAVQRLDECMKKCKDMQKTVAQTKRTLATAKTAFLNKHTLMSEKEVNDMLELFRESGLVSNVSEYGSDLRRGYPESFMMRFSPPMKNVSQADVKANKNLLFIGIVNGVWQNKCDRLININGRDSESYVAIDERFETYMKKFRDGLKQNMRKHMAYSRSGFKALYAQEDMLGDDPILVKNSDVYKQALAARPFSLNDDPSEQMVAQSIAKAPGVDSRPTLIHEFYDYNLDTNTWSLRANASEAATTNLQKGNPWGLNISLE